MSNEIVIPASKRLSATRRPITTQQSTAQPNGSALLTSTPSTTAKPTKSSTAASAAKNNTKISPRASNKISPNATIVSAQGSSTNVSKRVNNLVSLFENKGTDTKTSEPPRKTSLKSSTSLFTITSKAKRLSAETITKNEPQNDPSSSSLLERRPSIQTTKTPERLATNKAMKSALETQLNSSTAANPNPKTDPAPSTRNKWALSARRKTPPITETTTPNKPVHKEEAKEALPERDITLIHVLHNSDACAAFRTFVKAEFSEENLDFYFVVENLRKSKSADLSNDQANKIWEKYISTESSTAINVSEICRKNVQVNLKSLSGTKPNSSQIEKFTQSLIACQLEIIRLMEGDTFRRFSTSPTFTTLIKNKGKNDSSNVSKRFTPPLPSARHRTLDPNPSNKSKVSDDHGEGVKRHSKELNNKKSPEVHRKHGNGGSNPSSNSSSRPSSRSSSKPSSRSTSRPTSRRESLDQLSKLANAKLVDGPSSAGLPSTSKGQPLPVNASVNADSSDSEADTESFYPIVEEDRPLVKAAQITDTQQRKEDNITEIVPDSVAVPSVPIVDSQVASALSLLSSGVDPFSLPVAEHYALLAALQSRLQLSTPLVAPHRRILKEGSVRKESSVGYIPVIKPRWLTLCSDLLILETLKAEFKSISYLEGCTLDESTREGDKLFTLIITEPNTKALRLVFPTADERNEWKTTIQTVLHKLKEVPLVPTSPASPNPEYASGANQSSPNPAAAISPELRANLKVPTQKRRSLRMSQSANEGAQISHPYNVAHHTHVDVQFNWIGNDVDKTFTLKEELGRGSYGVVHRAEHSATGFPLAIKLLPASGEALSIKNEIELLRGMRNSSVVSYLGCWGPDKEGRLWIMMDLCEIGSVADLLQRTQTQCTERQVAYLIAANLRALTYLHAKGVVHRDVKPSNLLITQKAQVKLADFGVSTQLVEQTLGTESAKKLGGGEVVGSPLYMAPEVERGAPADASADIWSTGITALEIAEGKCPHAELSGLRVLRAIASSDPPKLLRKYWSERFHDFLRLCLQKDPKMRPSAADLLAHPFIMNAPDSACLLPLVKRFVHMPRKSSVIVSSQAILQSDIQPAQQYPDDAKRRALTTSHRISVSGSSEEEENSCILHASREVNEAFAAANDDNSHEDSNNLSDDVENDEPSTIRSENFCDTSDTMFMADDNPGIGPGNAEKAIAVNES